MRHIITTLLLVVALAVSAQPQGPRGPRGPHGPRPSREAFATMQAKYIADSLGLDEQTAKKFTDTYARYQKEIWAMRPQHHKGPKPEGQPTEQETEQELKARFERSQKMLDIRQRYYKEYSAYLTQQQIKKVYDIEQSMMRRLAKPHKKRK